MVLIYTTRDVQYGCAHEGKSHLIDHSGSIKMGVSNKSYIYIYIISTNDYID